MTTAVDKREVDAAFARFQQPMFKPTQCNGNRHVYDADKKGRIVSDRCRCGKGKPIKRMA